jgi:hypothetical protein
LTPSKMLVNRPLGSSFACSCAIAIMETDLLKDELTFADL